MGRAKLSPERKAANQERRRVGRERHEARKQWTYYPRRDALHFNDMVYAARKIRKAYVPTRGTWISGKFICGRQIDGSGREEIEEGDVDEEWTRGPSCGYEEAGSTGEVSLAEMIEMATVQTKGAKTKRRGAQFEMIGRRRDVGNEDARCVEELERWEADSDFWSEIDVWEEEWEVLGGEGTEMAGQSEAVPCKEYAAILKGELV